jgi:hypothetical protein
MCQAGRQEGRHTRARALSLSPLAHNINQGEAFLYAENRAYANTQTCTRKQANAHTHARTHNHHQGEAFLESIEPWISAGAMTVCRALVMVQDVLCQIPVVQRLDHTRRAQPSHPQGLHCQFNGLDPKPVNLNPIPRTRKGKSRLHSLFKILHPKSSIANPTAGSSVGWTRKQHKRDLLMLKETY